MERLTLRNRSDEPSAWAHNTGEFAERHKRIVQVLKHRIRQDAIEAAVDERQCMGIGQNVGSVAGEVHAYISKAEMSEGDSLIPRPTTEVEGVAACRQSCANLRHQFTRVPNCRRTRVGHIRGGDFDGTKHCFRIEGQGARKDHGDLSRTLRPKITPVRRAKRALCAFHFLLPPLQLTGAVRTAQKRQEPRHVNGRCHRAEVALSIETGGDVILQDQPGMRAEVM